MLNPAKHGPPSGAIRRPAAARRRILPVPAFPQLDSLLSFDTSSGCARVRRHVRAAAKFAPECTRVRRCVRTATGFASECTLAKNQKPRSQHIDASKQAKNSVHSAHLCLPARIKRRKTYIQRPCALQYGLSNPVRPPSGSIQRRAGTQRRILQGKRGLWLDSTECGHTTPNRASPLSRGTIRRLVGTQRWILPNSQRVRGRRLGFPFHLGAGARLSQGEEDTQSTS